MKKIVLVALMALCSVSFSFGVPTNSEIEELNKEKATKQCINEKTLECINKKGASVNSLDIFVNITEACYKAAEQIHCVN